jgi:hypothetical protein
VAQSLQQPDQTHAVKIIMIHVIRQSHGQPAHYRGDERKIFLNQRVFGIVIAVCPLVVPLPKFLRCGRWHDSQRRSIKRFGNAGSHTLTFGLASDWAFLAAIWRFSIAF